MADQTPKTTVTDLLELLAIHRRTLYELEKRAAHYERIAVPLELRNQLLEVREQMDAVEARLKQVTAGKLPTAVTELLQAAQLQQAQAEFDQVLLLQRIHQSNLAELAKRAAMHGPGNDPLVLMHNQTSEENALAELDYRLRQANDRLGELTAPLTTEPATALFSPILHVTIVTPNGERYATAVEADVLVAQLQAAFLADWQPPTATTLVHYALRRNADGPAIEPTLTLQQAQIVDRATLYVGAETLTETSPVGLVVEGPEGNRYTTAVRLDTVIRQLADTFLEMLNRRGEARIELLGGAREPNQQRTLRPNATLYEEQIGEGARLRIVPVA